MNGATLAAVSMAVAFAGFVQGSTGVGFALIVAPILGLLAPQWLPVSVLVLMLPLNLYVVWRERVALDWHSGAWITVGRFVGTFGGLAVLVVLSASHLNLLIGISTIAAALVTLAMPVFRPCRGVFVAAGLITGVTETATGIGGPPLALVYQHHPVAVMRSTIALCFVVGELISLAFLWQAGRVDALQLAHAAQLLPALLVGAALSQLVHHRMNAGVLRTFVMLFSIASGVVLIVRA
ncbi:MAG: sulfite exporter TauE/SafE family protein [Burkholderiales bacterium]|nr:sulfite exporter TauE/SafE family protein [Burkholderiales bacterium]